MKKYLFIVQDNICVANGKDVNATKLLQVMNSYGKVIDYDDSVAEIKAEYQMQIDSLTAQYNAIKEQKLTTDELDLIMTYRKNKAAVIRLKDGEINVYKNKLEKIKAVINE